MSFLPAGVYTSHALPTASVNIISPDTGAQYGIRDAVHNFSLSVVEIPFQSVSTSSRSLNTLPAGVYTTYSMITAIKSVIIPDAAQYGIYLQLLRVILLKDSNVVSIVYFPAPAILDTPVTI